MFAYFLASCLRLIFHGYMIIFSASIFDYSDLDHLFGPNFDNNSKKALQWLTAILLLQNKNIAYNNCNHIKRHGIF